VAFIIPHSQINLTQSLLVGYGDYFRYYDFPWIIIPIIALCLGFGVFGQVSTWIAGPSKGLLSVGKAGYLPPFFQKTNAHGVQIHILLVQAWCVTFMSIMFVILPSVQAAYQILTALAVTLYLTMYVLMFAAAISLRHSQPQTPRPYQVPCGDGGMWLLGGGGLVISLIAYIFGFLPPAQIAVGSPAVYIGILVFANILFVAIPFIIYACRKPHWKTAATGEDAIEPFSWEKPTVVITTPDQFN
jgi:amino acid transporter